jgi:hypothetical protein
MYFNITQSIVSNTLLQKGVGNDRLKRLEQLTSWSCKDHVAMHCMYVGNQPKLHLHKFLTKSLKAVCLLRRKPIAHIAQAINKVQPKDLTEKPHHDTRKYGTNAKSD